jgi:membrane protein YqaA with SNARE-associated domain
VLKKLYNWTLEQAAKPYAEKALAVVSFAESSFFPIPPDAMLIPMVLKRPDKAYRIALICTIASILGAMFGYAIGYFFAPLAHQVFAFFHYEKALMDFEAFMRQYGPWAILIKGLTPIPFKLVTIASGLAHMNIAIFLICCTITRGLRFFAVAYLVKRFGPEITEAMEKRFYLVGTIIVGILVALVVAIKLLAH